jgi:DNA repair exonuclease SbcCD ATPase subunit
MDAVALMEGYVKKIKVAEKQLTSLEKKAAKLAERHTELEEQRASIEQDISSCQSAISALESERQELFGEWSEATFSGNVQRQREIQQRRTEIERDKQDHHEQLESLRTNLAALTDDKQAIAETYTALDSLKLPDAWSYATSLREVLVSHQSELRSRIQKARLMLPKVNAKLVEEIRGEQRQHSEVEEINFAKRQQEKAEKDAAANREYAGAGAFGGPRRSEPDSRDFSS